MSFVRIENPVSVIPSMEMLRTLGASSARGHSEKIGQFGSGFPNTLALFARKGLLERFKVCLGKEVYTFPTKGSIAQTSRGDDFIINEILIKKQNGPTVNLNISTEFGALDWDCVTMGMRELISNAIDGTVEFGMPSHKTTIEVCDDNQTRAKEGTVRVYVPLTSEIEEYLSSIKTNFLCLSEFYNPDQVVLPNKHGGPCVVYRKGVRVGRFGKESLFHYNIPDIDLKESRIVDSSVARDRAASALLNASQPNIETFLRSFDDGKSYWEHEFSSYDLNPRYESNESQLRAVWSTAYKTVFGNAVLCETPEIARMVRDKGFNARCFPEKLASIIKYFVDSEAIQASSDVLTADESKGRLVCDPTSDVLDARDRLWGHIVKHGLTNGKSMPLAKCYTEITKSEGNAFGYYKDDCVYILKDIADRSFMLTQTMIEELAHHATGANDCTREFQDYAFRLAATMLHNA